MEMAQNYKKIKWRKTKKNEKSAKLKNENGAKLKKWAKLKKIKNEQN